MQTAESEHQQRARQTVRYINAINDHLYAHPQDHGQLSNQVIGLEDASDFAHFIQDGRVFVFQQNQPGLMSALQTMTRDSALLGRVKNRRLIDNRGADMQVAVPDLIPDDSLVYLN